MISLENSNMTLNRGGHRLFKEYRFNDLDLSIQKSYMYINLSNFIFVFLNINSAGQTLLNFLITFLNFFWF